MAELADALVSEASEETHGSSSLLGHTILDIIYGTLRKKETSLSRDSYSVCRDNPYADCLLFHRVFTNY